MSDDIGTARDGTDHLAPPWTMQWCDTVHFPSSLHPYWFSQSGHVHPMFLAAPDPGIMIRTLPPKYKTRRNLSFLISASLWIR